MFQIVPRERYVPSSGLSSVYLKVDLWNDFSFLTLFDMSLHDERGIFREIGSVKIGFIGQTTADPTYKKLPATFESVGEGFFSLGQSVEFYKSIASLSPSFREKVLKGLADIVEDPSLIERIEQEPVFGTSLLRNVSLSVIRGQFARVLEGLAERTDFKFIFERPQTEQKGGIEMDFNVAALSTPSTNIHALIGRNGVGKTTILNEMIGAVTEENHESTFLQQTNWGRKRISRDYFSSVVSVSFSAFDSFQPPREQSDPAKGTCYFYIGLKSVDGGKGHRSITELQKECARYLISCFLADEKVTRWERAIERLGSDENFASMELGRLRRAYNEVRTQIGLQTDSSAFRERYLSSIRGFLERMSSGHAIVLLTTTYLVARVEEKTLVLLDEPESHLHPPLLAAFIRALSDLLHDRNGVAIVATHSPVVLQEIPKSCVWKVSRAGLSMSKSRPDIETFAENLGLLTSEVFSLEVERSGFHAVLADHVGAGKSYDEIIDAYSGQLGLEGRAILRALIASRDSGDHDAPPQ